MTKSDSIAKLAEALSKAQGQIKNATKDSANPFFSSKYADLASVWEACRDALSANGLSVVQAPFSSEGVAGCTTILMHSSGEWIEEALPLKLVKNDPQGAGSAITYARRYALAGFAGIAPEDDDGNAASGKEKGQQPTKVKMGDVQESSFAPPNQAEKLKPPKPNGKAVPGIPEAQRKNFDVTFEKALRPELKKEATSLYLGYLAKNKINFDTMNPDDFYGARDEAEKYARTL